MVSEPREVEVWPCGYSSACSVPCALLRSCAISTTRDDPIVRWTCVRSTRKLCFEMKVIDRRSASRLTLQGERGPLAQVRGGLCWRAAR